MRRDVRYGRPRAGVCDSASACDARESRHLKLKEKIQIVKKRQSVFNAWQVGIMAVLLAGALVMWSAADARDVSFASNTALAKDETVFSTEDDRAFVATFVGDLMLGRDTTSVAQRYGYSALFDKTEALWADADYVFGNLECTLLAEGGTYTEAVKEEHFWAPDEAADALADAGFTIIQAANNHTVDYGSKGLKHTLRMLKESSIATVGAGANLTEAQAPAVDTYGSLTVKTFAVSDIVPEGSNARKNAAGILTFDTGDIYQAIADARADADLIVVGAHWGLGYTRTFTDDQQSMAHSLIDAGADVVIGTHTHTLAPIELYNGGIIFYGLGNFVSDDAWVRARDSVIVRLVVQDDGAVSFECHPLRIESGIPRPTSDAASIARDWAVLTRSLDAGSYEIESNVLSIPFKTLDIVEQATFVDVSESREPAGSAGSDESDVVVGLSESGELS